VEATCEAAIIIFYPFVYVCYHLAVIWKKMAMDFNEFEKLCGLNDVKSIVAAIHDDVQEILFDYPYLLGEVCEGVKYERWKSMFVLAARNGRSDVIDILLDYAQPGWRPPMSESIRAAVKNDQADVIDKLIKRVPRAELFIYMAGDVKLLGKLAALLSEETFQERCRMTLTDEWELMLMGVICSNRWTALRDFVELSVVKDSKQSSRDMVMIALMFADDRTIEYMLSDDYTIFNFSRLHGRTPQVRTMIEMDDDLNLLVVKRPGACLFRKFGILFRLRDTLFTEVRSVEMAHFIGRNLFSEKRFPLSVILDQTPRLPAEMVDYYCKYPSLVEEILQREVIAYLRKFPEYAGTLSYALEVMRQRYPTKLLTDLCLVGAYSVADHVKFALRGLDDYETELTCALKHCSILRDNKTLSRIVSGTDMTQLLVTSALDVYRTAQKTNDTHSPGIIVSHLAPRLGRDTFAHLFLCDYITGAHGNIDISVLDQFCFANQDILSDPGMIPTLYGPRGRTHKIVDSYVQTPGRNVMDCAIAADSVERVCALHFYGLYDANASVPHNPALDKILKVGCRGWDRTRHLVLGGSAMKKFVRHFLIATFVSGELSIEIVFLLASFINVRWFKPDAGPYVVRKDVIARLLKEWSAIRA